MAENLLLEYTEGMDAAKVGWGRVDMHKLRELLQLHTASEDIAGRTGYIARAQSSNLLSTFFKSMRAGSWRPSRRRARSPGPATGCSFSLATIQISPTSAGRLDLNWLIDGRRDDTPPGGALVFELWKQRGTEEYAVRTYYTAQTLDQMRNATALSLQSPPERVPVFVPGCSKDDFSCGWAAFQQAVHTGIDSMFAR